MFHSHIQVISRSSGRSVVACSAYRSGKCLIDQETGDRCDYRHKSGIVHTEVNLCEHAPEQFKDRQELWNAVQKIEKRSDAQLAREVEVALPRGLDRSTQIEIIKKYVDKFFVSQGMIADWALHDKGNGNPHCHILLTIRPIEADGSWGKKETSRFKLDEEGNKIPVMVEDPATGEMRQKLTSGGRRVFLRELVPSNDWNAAYKAEEWRKEWADVCNPVLESRGLERIDHRSYARQGIDLEPTFHIGIAAWNMEKKGIQTDVGDEFRAIVARNQERIELRDDIARDINRLGDVIDTTEKKTLISNFSGIKTAVSVVSNMGGIFSDMIVRPMQLLIEKITGKEDTKFGSEIGNGFATEEYRSSGGKISVGRTDTDAFIGEVRAAVTAADVERQLCLSERADRDDSRVGSGVSRADDPEERIEWDRGQDVEEECEAGIDRESTFG